MSDTKKISKTEVDKLLNEWAKEFVVLVPSQDSGVARMSAWDGKGTAFLEWYRNTVVPPKNHILPSMEEMFRFKKNKNEYNIELPSSGGRKQLIFGVRPCDARALSVLDMLFKDAYEDPYYMPRRKDTVLVGIGCTDPYDSCFCTSMGIAPAESRDVDIMLTDTGAEFIVEGITETGKALIGGSGLLKEAGESDEAKAGEARKAAFDRVTRKLDTKDIGHKLRDSFDNHEYWERTAAKCISCGICTLLCPTCYCFDINDEMVREQGTRYRSCDSCAFPVYTKMPMENPREEKWQRVRQKVCHKYEFFPMNFDVIACTGCGRCIRLCPVNWDITQALANLPANKQPELEKQK